MNLKKNGKVFKSKYVGTGSSSYEKEFTGPRSHKGWETLPQTVWSSLYLDVFQTGEHHIAYQVNIIVVPVLSHTQNAIYIYSIAWDLRLFQLAERLGEMFFHGVSATPRCTVSVVCEAG